MYMCICGHPNWDTELISYIVSAKHYLLKVWVVHALWNIILYQYTVTDQLIGPISLFCGRVPHQVPPSSVNLHCIIKIQLISWLQNETYYILLGELQLGVASAQLLASSYRTVSVNILYRVGILQSFTIIKAIMW